MKKIRKKINGYLKNITENTIETIKENAILNKDKINYIKDGIKHTIIIKEKEISIIRESEDFKNILTFSENRSILSEYIIKQNNLTIYIEIQTLYYRYKDNELCIKYKIIDSDTIYEYKITMEE